jgi:hypothetical protein
VPPTAPGPGGSARLVDAHVHLHACFDLPTCLDAAAANVRQASLRHGYGKTATGCLLLTEASGMDEFGRLRRLAEGGSGSTEGALAGTGWSVLSTAEPGSILARHDSGPRLFIMAGRQIATTDGLEVLALLTMERFEQPVDLPGAIAEVHAVGAIPVIPWGFGKWSLRRGKLVARAIRDVARPLFLGDNGGRPRSLPTPRLLRQAAGTGTLILPGSDPLPFPDQQIRVGSRGFITPLHLDGSTPARQLGDWLRELRVQPRMYGAGERVGAFARNQVRMQVRKRLS